MSAVLLLLYVTLMPFAPILVDRTTVSARLDTVAMEKLAKVGENTLFISKSQLNKEWRVFWSSFS